MEEYKLAAQIGGSVAHKERLDLEEKLGKKIGNGGRGMKSINYADIINAGKAMASAFKMPPL